MWSNVKVALAYMQLGHVIYPTVNINGYVPFLINTLDTIVRGGNLLTKYSPLAGGTFFTLLVSIVFC